MSGDETVKEAGMSGFTLIGPDSTHLGLIKMSFLNRKMILKYPGFSHLVPILAQPETKCAMPAKEDVYIKSVAACDVRDGLVRCERCACVCRLSLISVG